MKMVFATGDATFQLAAPATWKQWDTGHTQHSRFVAVMDSKVIGWVALSPISARDCYKGVCELSIYIDSDYRGKGIGKMLMQVVVESSKLRVGGVCIQAPSLKTKQVLLCKRSLVLGR